MTRAVLRHKGRYQCNINHKNSHFLNVHPSQRTTENKEELDEEKFLFDSEDDHEDKRIRFELSSESDRESTTSVSTFNDIYYGGHSESDEFYGVESHEKFLKEPTTHNFVVDEFDTTPQISTTTLPLLPSLTKIPSTHSTHATTHTNNPSGPSEAVIVQTHLESLRFKGSQK